MEFECPEMMSVKPGEPLLVLNKKTHLLLKWDQRSHLRKTAYIWLRSEGIRLLLRNGVNEMSSMAIMTIELTSRTWRKIRRRIRRQRQQAKRKPVAWQELVSDITAQQLRDLFGLGAGEK